MTVGETYRTADIKPYGDDAYCTDQCRKEKKNREGGHLGQGHGKHGRSGVVPSVYSMNETRIVSRWSSKRFREYKHRKESLKPQPLNLKLL